MWLTISEYLKKINTDSRQYFEINDRIFEVTPDKIPLDFDAVFKNNNETVKLEIGFGNGDSLTKLALKNPGTNYFGIDRKMDRVRIALGKLNKIEKIPNLVISRLGTDFIDQIVKPASCDEIIIHL